MPPTRLTRRHFLLNAAAALAPPAEPVIDIHQHTNYWGRSDENLVRHQRLMGVARTVLLPAGSRYGLYAECYGNDSVLALARRHPGEFLFFANELPDLAGARQVIEKYLKMGAIGIGEQKFPVECDSPHIFRIAEIARDYGVPVLMHFEYGKYNTGFERFHRVLEKFPAVNFIGHAQTWWANISRDHDQKVLYPKTKVIPGGITDRLLSDYPNIYGDFSAGSGLNALLRDEDHARQFLVRHQDRLLWGSDCQDADTQGDVCVGSRSKAAIQRLAPSPRIARKILYHNAVRLLKLS